jgi:hypothetical protein
LDNWMAREVVHESNHKICKLVSLAGFMLKFERMYHAYRTG